MEANGGTDKIYPLEPWLSRVSRMSRNVELEGISRNVEGRRENVESVEGAFELTRCVCDVESVEECRECQDDVECVECVERVERVERCRQSRVSSGCRESVERVLKECREC
eukprot:6919705-Prymnesium_polylepis.1